MDNETNITPTYSYIAMEISASGKKKCKVNLGHKWAAEILMVK